MELEKTLHGYLYSGEIKIAAAESCTGGLVAHRITNIPGSSAYFTGGIVAYSYEAKVRLLGVSWDTLHAHGAVSEEVVLEMACGARKVFEADIAVSISGIAGPGGGTTEKPVGTIWLGLCTPKGEWTRHFLLDGSREENKHHSSEAALKFIMDHLEGKLK